MSNDDKAATKTIALNDASIEKVDSWLGQIENKRVNLSRKEFLNWLIEKLPESLSSADLNAIADRYYDEEKFLRQLLRKTRHAKRSGISSNVEIVVRPKKMDAKRGPSLEPDDSKAE